VLDPAYGLYSRLLQSYDEGRSRDPSIASFSHQLRHPSCRHVIAGYASFIYNHGDYHFNNRGEYSFDLLPSEAVVPLPSNGLAATDWVAVTPSAEGVANVDWAAEALALAEGESEGAEISTSTTTTGATAGDDYDNREFIDRHDLVVWPDRVLVRNLRKEHIPAVYKLCLQDSLWQSDEASLKELLSSVSTPAASSSPAVAEVVVERLARVLVVVSCESTTIQKASEILDWFRL
jgi:hypothetical protein